MNYKQKLSASHTYSKISGRLLLGFALRRTKRVLLTFYLDCTHVFTVRNVIEILPMPVHLQAHGTYFEKTQVQLLLRTRTDTAQATKCWSVLTEYWWNQTVKRLKFPYPTMSTVPCQAGVLYMDAVNVLMKNSVWFTMLPRQTSVNNLRPCRQHCWTQKLLWNRGTQHPSFVFKCFTLCFFFQKNLSFCRLIIICSSRIS